jgi:hypothetical protein
MGHKAYLKITRHQFSSNNQIPYTWTIIFDKFSPSGIWRTSVGCALEVLRSKGVNLDNLENHLANYTGWDVEYWNRYRHFVLTEDSGGLEKKLEEDGFDANDDYPNVLDLLEQLEVDEGLWELVALYKMCLALHDSNLEDKVILNLKEFRPFYDNFKEVPSDIKRNFIDRVKMYDYLFDYTVDRIDKVSAVHEKIKQFSEDDLIDRVILPLLNKMGFQKIERIPHHGQSEHGLDIRPFYEIDKFNRRIYTGAQVKARDIHTNSRKEGNAASINNQIDSALNSEFLDIEDNEKKQIDKILLITSGKVNDDAREYLSKTQPNRTLGIIDGAQLSNYIVTYGLMYQILHTKKSIKRKQHRKQEMN